MPLTPEDVRNKQFTTVRLREGYDEDEVDAFLDEVEAELTSLLRENEELRAKLAAATRAAQQAQAQAQQAQAAAAAGGPPALRKERPEPVPAPVPQLPTGAHQLPTGAHQLPGHGPGGGGDSAARVLALAQQTADQAIAEARAEANKIIGEARQKAEQIERDARIKADALERDAQEKHRVMIGTLENQRAGLERKVDDLRAFEREYRTRLKSYLESQLRQLEGQGDETLAPPPRPAAASLPQGMSPSHPQHAPHTGAHQMPQMAPQMPPGPQMPPSPQMPQAPRPAAPQPQPVQQAPTPMRGFLLDEDPDN